MIISKIIPDERSNQLIVIATERSYQRVKRMVDQLDKPIEGGDGRIHVYYCENANCDELAQTLGAVTGVAVSVSQGGAAAGHERGRQARRPRRRPRPRPGGQGQGIQNLLFEGEVRINFDRPTNSLIIVSSLKDYQAVRRVIERLDSPRKQVFVEAMILEVTLDKSRELGASFHGAKPFEHPRAGQPEPGRRRPEPRQDAVPGGRADRDDAGRRARPGAVARRGQEPGRGLDGDRSTSRRSAC